MDVERIIDDIEQLQEMFEAPDIRPLSPSASPLRIAGTMRCSRTARGFASGSGMASAADVSLTNSDWAKSRAKRVQELGTHPSYP
jgi:hypothetical protein